MAKIINFNAIFVPHFYAIVSHTYLICCQVNRCERDLFFQNFFMTTARNSKIVVAMASPLIGDLETIKDYESLFVRGQLEVPDGLTNWREDAEFGQQRLSGVNPIMIELCQQIPER